MAGHTRHDASRLLLERLSQEGGTVALAAEHPEIADRMLHQLRKWQQSCRDLAAVYGIGR